MQDTPYTYLEIILIVVLDKRDITYIVRIENRSSIDLLEVWYHRRFLVWCNRCHLELEPVAGKVAC